MRIGVALAAGITIGFLAAVVATVMAYEAIGRAATLDKAPDRIPDAWLVTT